MVIVIFLALAAVTLPEPNCAECHRAIADSYAKTGMANSFHAARQLPHFRESGVGLFKPLERDGGDYVVRAATADVPSREVSVDYAIGSGGHAVTYLHRTRDNKLIELPISWYSEQGGHWGMSPGYDRPAHPGFSRPASYRCMFCHNAYPAIPSGYASVDGASVFPTALPSGIDCQRCHGSGTAHANAVRQHKPLAEIRAAIVNPARLAPARQLEVCMQCHLETTSAEFPGSIMKFDRGVFSYRPGEPLGAYNQYFDHAPNTGHVDKFEIVSEAYRLRQSACFLKSEGRLTCTTCHNPHRAAMANPDAVCANCHTPHTAEGSCTGCHMPKRQASDAIHIAVTDHRIARIPAPQLTLVEQNEANTPPYKGAVVAYYPQPADPLYLAAANQKVLKSAFPEAYFRAGYFEQALKLDPGNWRYLYGLGNARLDAAMLERAAALAPWETNILEALGAAYAANSRIADAVRIFREATDRDPEDAAAFSNLGNALLQAGDKGGAEKAFLEAVRLLPEVPGLRENLRRLK
jgi:Tetratricopeptide repeat